MPQYTDIAHETYRKMILDSGIVRKNFSSFSSMGTRIGATRDGATFEVKTEMRTMPVDGAKGPVKGDKRIAKVEASLEVTFIEIDASVIQLALPGSTTEETPAVQSTHIEVARALQIALTDYLTNIALIAQVAGSSHPIVLKLDNPLATGDFQLGMKDANEAGVKVKFLAHFDPNDLVNEPWLIDFPSDVLTTEGA